MENRLSDYLDSPCATLAIRDIAQRRSRHRGSLASSRPRQERPDVLPRQARTDQRVVYARTHVADRRTCSDGRNVSGLRRREGPAAGALRALKVAYSLLPDSGPCHSLERLQPRRLSWNWDRCRHVLFVGIGLRSGGASHSGVSAAVVAGECRLARSQSLARTSSVLAKPVMTLAPICL